MDRNAKHDRKKAHFQAKVLVRKPLVIFDTETTGLDNTAEIVEIACIDGKGNVLLDSLIKPSCPIPPGATAVHGITDADVCDAHGIGGLLGDLEVAWKGKTVAAYNLDYDLRLLRQSMAAAYADGVLLPIRPNADIMGLYAQYHGDWNEYHQSYTWQSLVKAMGQCGLSFEGTAHRALADVKASLAVLQYMAAVE